MRSANCAAATSKGRSQLPTDPEMIKGVNAAAMNEEIERRHSPHRGVLEAERIPEIATDAPAFHIGDGEKDEDRHGYRPRKQAERKKRPAQELSDRDRSRPQLSRTITALVELCGERSQAVNLEAGAGKAAECHPQAVGNQCEADDGAQQRLCDGCGCRVNVRK